MLLTFALKITSVQRRLVECETGQTLRRLVSGDRLKPYMAERLELEARLPSRIPKIPRADREAPADNREQADGLQTANRQTSPKKASSSGKQQQQKAQRRYAESTQKNNSGFYPAWKILAERVRKGTKEYLVHFVDNSKLWSSQVTPTLLRHYKLQKERIKEQHRKRRQQKRGQVRNQ